MDKATLTEREKQLGRATRTLIHACRQHRRVADRRCIGIGLNQSQHRLLMHISRFENIPSQKELAEHFDVSPAAIAVSLKRLEGDGYIERGKNTEKSDTRQNEIRITEKGRAEIVQTGEYFRLLDSQTFEGFDSDEIADFISYLERIQQNLSALEAQNGRNTAT